MTASSKPTADSAIRSPRWRALCRVAGLAAVVLGGWCLWLGFPATPKPLESEAYRDWNDEQTSPAPPRQLKASEFQPGRLAARITHVSDSKEFDALQDSHVVPASRSDDAEKNDGGFAVANYALDVDDEPRRLTQEAKVPAGAWLTGTIEDGVSADSGGLSQIPPWKRSSKSLPQRVKTPR